MKQFCALCLAVLLLLVPILCLFDIIDRIERSQQYQSNSAESEPIQVHVNCPLIIIMLDSQTEPTIATEPTVPTVPTEATQPMEEQPKETQPTVPQQSNPVPDSPKPADRPANYYGRLVIPDAGIDVALYYGADQAICDREDSANIFAMSVFDGLYIADHNNQEFGKLFNVKVGMRGYLRLADGAVFNIVCTDVLTGHNTGKHIIDENGNTNLDADFLMYTCRDSWQNILICLWKHG